MHWNTGLYTREEIDNARPVVSTLGNYPFAECLRVRVSDFDNKLTVVDYSELYAFNHYTSR